MLLPTILPTALLLLTSTTTTSALPALLRRWPSSAPPSLRPSSISTYHIDTGAITPNVGRGQVSRHNWDGHDVSTLVTFDLKAAAYSPPTGATCRLKFYLDGSDDTSAIVRGQVDVFASLQPAPAEGSAGWGGPGNQRDTPLGRLEPVYTGYARVVQDVGPRALQDGFPCPRDGDYRVQGGLVGYEVAPAGDQVDVEWTAALSGLVLEW